MPTAEHSNKITTRGLQKKGVQNDETKVGMVALKTFLATLVIFTDGLRSYGSDPVYNCRVSHNQRLRYSESRYRPHISVDHMVPISTRQLKPSKFDLEET
jgi:hypothetical protein